MEGSNKNKRPNFQHMKKKKKKTDKNSMTRDDVRVSKKLSYILRHGAKDLNIFMADDGFVFVDEMLQKGKVRASFERIQKVVANNNKKRFELVQDENQRWKIRAVQGHTLRNVDQEKLLTKITDPKAFAGMTVVHGTYLPAWKEIQFGGLNRMSRNHMHFAKGYNFHPDNGGDSKNEVISGMRNTCDIYIEIDPCLAMAEGIDFYESKNGVILSEGYSGNLPVCFFKSVYVRGDKLDAYKKEIGSTSFDLNLLKKGANPYKDGPLLDESKLDASKPLRDQKLLVMNNTLGEPFVNHFGRKYLFVMDFEANCVKKGKLNPQEIVEFPVVPIDTVKQEIVPEMVFHTYIKPKHHALTPFCTELTGITEDMVSKGVHLEIALDMFEEHLKKHNVASEDFVFVTCGAWDLNTCLRNEAKFKNINLPSHFRRFVNLKTIYSKTQRATGKIGMVGMLAAMELELEGKHHSGIDDSKNIAKILCKILKQGAFVNRAFEQKV